MGMLVRLALATRQPFSEVMTWEPGHIATALQWLKEQAAVTKGSKG